MKALPTQGGGGVKQNFINMRKPVIYTWNTGMYKYIPKRTSPFGAGPGLGPGPWAWGPAQGVFVLCEVYMFVYIFGMYLFISV